MKYKSSIVALCVASMFIVAKMYLLNTGYSVFDGVFSIASQSNVETKISSLSSEEEIYTKLIRLSSQKVLMSVRDNKFNKIIQREFNANGIFQLFLGIQEEERLNHKDSDVVFKNFFNSYFQRNKNINFAYYQNSTEVDLLDYRAFEEFSSYPAALESFSGKVKK